MSMILDALKRAERDRKLEKAPDLSAIYQEEHPSRRKYRPWFWGGGVALVLLAAVVVIFWPKESSKPDLTASVPSKGPAAESPSAPLSSAGKAVKMAPLPAPAPPAKKKLQKGKRRGSVSKNSLPVPRETAQEMVDTVKLSPDKTDQLAAPLPEKQIAVPKPAAEPVRNSVVSETGERHSTTTAKVVPKAQPKEAFPLYNDLPEETQSVLGPLEINVHMYSPNPSERRVFINMRGYREGDPIGENGFRVVEITSHGVVIDYGQGKALLEVNGK